MKAAGTLTDWGTNIIFGLNTFWPKQFEELHN